MNKVQKTTILIGILLIGAIYTFFTLQDSPPEDRTKGVNKTFNPLVDGKWKEYTNSRFNFVTMVPESYDVKNVGDPEIDIPPKEGFQGVITVSRSGILALRNPIATIHSPLAGGGGRHPDSTSLDDYMENYVVEETTGKAIDSQGRHADVSLIVRVWDSERTEINGLPAIRQHFETGREYSTGEFIGKGTYNENGLRYVIETSEGQHWIIAIKECINIVQDEIPHSVRCGDESLNAMERVATSFKFIDSN